MGSEARKPQARSSDPHHGLAPGDENRRRKLHVPPGRQSRFHWLRRPSKLSKYLPIVKKLGKAYRQRGIQTAELTSFIDNSPYPIILGGDFNDTPSSFAYQQVNELLDDSFIKKGKGIGSTYNGIIPFLRIDYIFTDKKFTCTHYQKIKNLNSDHFPIIADIILNNK